VTYWAFTNKKDEVISMRGLAFTTDWVRRLSVGWAEAVEITEGRGTSARTMLPVEPIGVIPDGRSDNRPISH
jgi:hypothetical protein